MTPDGFSNTSIILPTIVFGVSTPEACPGPGSPEQKFFPDHLRYFKHTTNKNLVLLPKNQLANLSRVPWHPEMTLPPTPPEWKFPFIFSAVRVLTWCCEVLRPWQMGLCINSINTSQYWRGERGLSTLYTFLVFHPCTVKYQISPLSISSRVCNKLLYTITNIFVTKNLYTSG